MCSKRASDPQRLWEIVKRKILLGLFISVSIAALSPFVLGYALYRMLVGWGVVFVPQNAFFLIGLVTSFSLAWGLSSCIVAFLKVRHLVVRPIERLASAAAYRMDHGSVDDFRVKTRVEELARLIALFSKLFRCQDERVAELAQLIHVFGHNACCHTSHIGGKAFQCLDPLALAKRREEHLRELPQLAIRETNALDEHINLCVGIVDNYNRIKGPPFAAVDVVSVANACLARLKPDADAKRLFLSAALPSECVVWAHEEKLADVIDNLVSNAIKYTPEGGRVSLSVTRQTDNLVLAVTDTGRGIAAEYRERIFDPAFRCPEMKDEKGSGFGLSFVRSVARFYNGTCTCQSERGKGSTFTVTLPLVDAAACRV